MIVSVGKQLAREWRVCKARLPLYICVSFLTAFCGILLWVNGTAAPVVFHTAVIPWSFLGLSGHFVLWLLLYALFGLQIALLASVPGVPWKDSACAVVAFTLCLAWYPVFFSFWHTVFALVLLGVSFCLSVAVWLRSLRYTLLGMLCTVPVLFFESYFIVWTVLFALGNS